MISDWGSGGGEERGRLRLRWEKVERTGRGKKRKGEEGKEELRRRFGKN
jgi:hypothetical protein